jgi:hypothetical protein
LKVASGIFHCSLPFRISLLEMYPLTLFLKEWKLCTWVSSRFPKDVSENTQ